MERTKTITEDGLVLEETIFDMNPITLGDDSPPTKVHEIWIRKPGISQPACVYLEDGKWVAGKWGGQGDIFDTREQAIASSSDFIRSLRPGD